MDFMELERQRGITIQVSYTPWVSVSIQLLVIIMALPHRLPCPLYSEKPLSIQTHLLVYSDPLACIRTAYDIDLCEETTSNISINYSLFLGSFWLPDPPPPHSLLPHTPPGRTPTSTSSTLRAMWTSPSRWRGPYASWTPLCSSYVQWEGSRVRP